MAETDDTRQTIKHHTIDDHTVVIGVTLGREFHALCLMNKEGDTLGSYPEFSNTRKGFDAFHALVEETKQTYGFTHVVIGIEPTGHAVRKLAAFAQENGYDVRLVRTAALRRNARAIALLVKEGHALDTRMEESVYRQLRSIAHTRESVLRHYTASQRALRAILDDCFPELRGIFPSLKSKGLRALLTAYPFPDDVLKAGCRGVTELLRKSAEKKALKRAQKVVAAAEESVGVTAGKADRMRLMISLDDYTRSAARLKELDRELTDLLTELPFSASVLSLPGVGPVTCGVFFGELGNPASFTHPKKITSYAGYDPREQNVRGTRAISKRGRPLLRKYLYLMSLGVVKRSSFFKQYYERKQKNPQGKQRAKKEALCAVAIKLIRVIFALIRDRRSFTETMDHETVEGGPKAPHRQHGLDEGVVTFHHPLRGTTHEGPVC
jgi:transposase